ncbi:MAG: transporter [Methanosarcina sp. 795]|nr:MAG: transporter [Methanosarcina sp. 795]
MIYTAVDKLAYRYFGGFFYKNRESFKDLKLKIRQSHISMTVDQYLASALMYSIIVGTAGGIFGLSMGLKIFGDPVSRLSLFMNSTSAGYAEKYVYPLAILTATVMLIICSLIVFFLIYSYPYFQSNNRRACIDRSILPSIIYMYALMKGGMSVYDVFRSISMYTHIFGASAEEISYIVRDMDYLGKDFISALNSAKERTPSDIFKDFIDGLIIISNSGTINEYIKSKADQYQYMAELANRSLLQRLDVLAEVYVTALVAGPFFIMVTLVVLQFFKPASTQALYMLIYVILPVATLLYLVILDTVGELSFNPKKGKVSSFSINLADIPEIESGLTKEKEEERSKKYRMYRQLSIIKDMLLNPYRTLRDEPRYTFFITVPAGLLYLTNLPEGIANRLSFSPQLNINFDHVSEGAIKLATTVDDYIIIFTIILLIPFIIFYEIKAWRIRQIDERMPDFLRNLSSMNDSGILLANSLKLIAESKMGILSKELMKLKEDLSWGTSTSRALMKLENSIRTASSSRIIHILVKANESTSDLTSVLSITAAQAKIEEGLKKERSSQMVIYIVTIYISFFVFLFIVYILATDFFPQTASFTAAAQAGGTGGIGNSYFNIDEYNMLMFHSALVQAVTSGLIAGKMGQGSAYLGLKYSVSMLIIAYLAFNFFV